MLQQKAQQNLCAEKELGSIQRFNVVLHHPRRVYHNIDYTLQPPLQDYRATFYTSEKNSGTFQVNSLILKCEDKRLFKTTVTGKPLAQVKENPGKHLYLLVYALVSFISGVSGFDTTWGQHSMGIFSFFNTTEQARITSITKKDWLIIFHYIEKTEFCQ